MSEADLKHRVNALKDVIILSNTRVNYLLQLFDLVRAKNRIVMRHEGFYATIIRDFNRSMLIDLRVLAERRVKTHNLRTLTCALEKFTASNCDTITAKRIRGYCQALRLLLNDPIVSSATILASTQAAHRALKPPSQEIKLTYEHMSEWLKKVADTLNEISSCLWSTSTHMSEPSSDGDSFKREFEHMEHAELAGSHLLRIDDSHEAVAYAHKILASK